MFMALLSGMLVAFNVPIVVYYAIVKNLFDDQDLNMFLYAIVYFFY